MRVYLVLHRWFRDGEGWAYAKDLPEGLRNQMRAALEPIIKSRERVEHDHALPGSYMRIRQLPDAQCRDARAFRPGPPPITCAAACESAPEDASGFAAAAEELFNLALAAERPGEHEDWTRTLDDPAVSPNQSRPEASVRRRILAWSAIGIFIGAMSFWLFRNAAKPALNGEHATVESREMHPVVADLNEGSSLPGNSSAFTSIATSADGAGIIGDSEPSGQNNSAAAAAAPDPPTGLSVNAVNDNPEPPKDKNELVWSALTTDDKNGRTNGSTLTEDDLEQRPWRVYGEYYQRIVDKTGNLSEAKKDDARKWLDKNSSVLEIWKNSKVKPDDYNADQEAEIFDELRKTIPGYSKPENATNEYKELLDYATI